MRKLNILPLAEKVSISGANEPVYTKKGFGINIPDKVFLIMFIATCITLFIYPFAVFFMLGGVCFLYGINKAKTPPTLRRTTVILPSGSIQEAEDEAEDLARTEVVHKDIRKHESTFYNNLRFFFVGAFLIFIAVGFIKYQNSDTFDREYTDTFVKCFDIALAAVTAGRGIFLFTEARAISDRKKTCTVNVGATHTGNTVNNDVKSIYATKPPFVKPIFTYSYNDVTYRLTDHMNMYRDEGDIELFIDPDAPERYYSMKLFCYNKEDIRQYFFNTFFIAAFTFVLWVPYLITWISGL